MSRSLRTFSLLSRSALPLPATQLPIAARARAFSSSPLRLFAVPQTGPQTVSSGPIRTPHPAQSSTASAQSTPADAGAVTSGRPEWPDYSKGPSALDKASQLFFFTEIVRGASFIFHIYGCCRAADRVI